METQCEEILANRMQCTNAAYGYVGEMPACRMHMAFYMNNPTYTDFSVCDPANQADLDTMLKSVKG